MDSSPEDKPLVLAGTQQTNSVGVCRYKTIFNGCNLEGERLSDVIRATSVLFGVLLLALSTTTAGCISDDAYDFQDEEVELSHREMPIVAQPDSRQPISQSASTAYPWRAVAALRRTPYMTSAHCSAFKVGPRYLLTAAHCLYDLKRDGSFGLIVNPKNRRIVYGQYGSGNVRSNMPFTGSKIPIEDAVAPKGYVETRGNSSVDDWALLRVSDANSTPGWFRVGAWSNAELRAFASPTSAGHPQQDRACANSPAWNGSCGGYQYRAASSDLRLSPSIIDTHSDWDVGQSGGPFFGLASGVSQRVAMGIIHGSDVRDGGHSYSRRITSDIVSLACKQIGRYPSARYPNHECN